MSGPKVTLQVDGGVLEVDWQEDGVWLSGPVARVFEGTVAADYLAAVR